MTRETPFVFPARLELLPWGRNVYTVLKIPDELAGRARDQSTRRIAGTIEGVEVNVGLNRADVIPETFVYVGSGLRDRLGAAAGDLVRCVLAPVDPDEVPVPDDVRDALQAAGRRAAFDRLPATERRRLLAPVDGAARPATRQRRIAALVAGLPIG